MPKPPRATTSATEPLSSKEDAAAFGTIARTNGRAKTTTRSTVKRTAAAGAVAPKQPAAAVRVRRKTDVRPAAESAGFAPAAPIPGVAAAASLAQKPVGAGKAAPAAAYVPTLDEIALRAYQIYQRRGGMHGHDVDDWVEAERQLRKEHRS